MKILIVKTSSLGDIIHVFPVVEYLKSIHSDVQIDWVVESPFAELVRAHPQVNDVLCIDSKAWRKAFWKPYAWRECRAFKKALQSKTYDVVFDLQGNTKSGIVTGFANSPQKVGFAKKDAPEAPNILFTTKRYALAPHRNIRLDYLSIVQQYYGDTNTFTPAGVQLHITAEDLSTIDETLSKAAPKTRSILVCPGSAWPNKQLSEETLLKFLGHIHAEGPSAFFLAWGNAQEKATAEKLHQMFSSNSIVLERLRLPALQNLMSRMDAVIAMDSLPLHLAGTAGVPTFSAFGASSAAKYKPPGPLHITVQGNCPYNRQFEKRCPILRTCPTGKCIKDLRAEDLYQKWSER